MPKSEMRRMACQIAAQLPDSQAEALEVLDYVRDIVMNLGGGWGQPTAVPPTQLYAVSPTSRATVPEAATEDPTDLPNRANPG